MGKTEIRGIISGACVLGVDPGISGGLAVLRLGLTPELIYACPMPETELDLVDTIWTIRACINMAGIERVHSMPKQGVASSFKFGYWYGLATAAVMASHIPMIHVNPMAWQTKLQCLSHGDKKITKRRAQELFPNFNGKITHRLADAILIAEFTRQELYKRISKDANKLEDL